MEVYFSVLSYYPSFITSECINVAVLFYNKDTDERLLEVTTKWQRIRGFDDEIDLDFFKATLFGIREEIKQSFWSNNSDFEIQRYIKRFVNELRFSKIIKIETADFGSFITETKKMFLRYDFEKRDRPNRDEQISYIKRLLRETNVKLENGKAKGIFNEVVNYDYIFDGYAFKIFSFSGKDLNKIVTSAKSWAYTAKEMNDSMNYKTIFVYDADIKDDKFEIIYKILNEYAYKVMRVPEAISYVIKLNENKNGIDSLICLTK